MVSHAYLDNPDETTGGRDCPFCDYHADSVREEVAHMEMQHREIIANRLHAAGLHPEADAFEKQEPSLSERVAHARAELRSDENLPEWTPPEWVNALAAKLGESAYHSAQFLQAIRRVFPGSAADSMEQFKYSLIAVAAVAMDAVEAMERE